MRRLLFLAVLIVALATTLPTAAFADTLVCPPPGASGACVSKSEIAAAGARQLAQAQQYQAAQDAARAQLVCPPPGASGACVSKSEIAAAGARQLAQAQQYQAAQAQQKAAAEEAQAAATQAAQQKAAADAAAAQAKTDAANAAAAAKAIADAKVAADKAAAPPNCNGQTIPYTDKLRAVVGGTVLKPVVTCPITDPNTGDISQQTQDGMLYQRAATGYTSFTNGGTNWTYATDPDGRDDAYVWTSGELDPPDGAATVNQQKATADAAAAQAAAEAAAAANVAAAEHCRVILPGNGYFQLFTGAGATAECDLQVRLLKSKYGAGSWDATPASGYWLCQLYGTKPSVTITVVVDQPSAPGDAFSYCANLGAHRWAPGGLDGIAAPLG
jgi:hypothetical protein